MPQHHKSWVHLVLVSAVGLATGYILPRPSRRGGDMLDAVAAVQRRAPRFVISEPAPGGTWARTGELYLCLSPKTVDQVDGLSKYPGRADHRWAGVVCFRGTADPNARYVPWVSEKGKHRHLYGRFAVFGDPEEMRKVQAILAEEGFRRIEEP
jgi:hypothetical protein